jgi:hypothetical protein
MAIPSPVRRLRLFILSLSLFCFGVAAQSISTPPGVTIHKIKSETFTNVNSTGSVAAPGSNPNRLPLPSDGSAIRIERTELHAYSMELSNDGPKPIRAVAWDFIFAERKTNVEQLRHSFANLQKIDTGQTKTVKFTTSLGPPRVIDAAGLGKDPRALFTENVQLQCVLFADGSTWEAPNAAAKPCERLARWLERRKTWHPGPEDLPFNP